MHSLWCCVPRQGRLKKSSFTSIFKASRKNPVVITSDSQISKADFKSEEVSPFGGPIELCQISESHADTKDVRPSLTLTRTNTFESIKTRMIKHLSQEGGTRRQSRVSIGHSDEELARRAEVRRLRQKRIQDELERDDQQDVSSVKSKDSTRRLAAFADLGSPRSGPRDTIEFTVDDCAVTSSQDSDFSSRCSHSSSVNCSRGAQTGSACLEAECNPPMETQSDMDDVPSRTSPVRGPLPGRRCTSMASASPRPSSCEPGSSRMERVLGWESDFNIRHGSHAWDDQSALGVWLIAQGMKLNDHSATQPEQDTHAQRDEAPRLSSVRDIGGVDSIIESSFSKSSGASKAQTVHSADAEQEKLEPGDLNTEEINSTCPHSDSARGGKARDRGSSNYPSVMPSVDSSLSVAEEHSYILSQKDMENLELSPIRWYGRLPTWKDMGHSEGKSSYTTAEEQFLSNATDDNDISELLGAYITTSDTSGKSSIRQGPDLNKPLPALKLSGHSDTEPHASSGLFGEASVDESQATPKRTSLKQKLQQSLSGLSKRSGNHTTGP